MNGEKLSRRLIGSVVLSFPVLITNCHRRGYKTLIVYFYYVIEWGGGGDDIENT